VFFNRFHPILTTLFLFLAPLTILTSALKCFFNNLSSSMLALLFSALSFRFTEYSLSFILFMSCFFDPGLTFTSTIIHIIDG